MIGWTTIAPFLLELFGELARDPALVEGARPFKAEWKEGQRSAVHDVQRFSLLLKLTNVSSVGRDENRREFFQQSISGVTQTGPGPGVAVSVSGALSESAHGLITITTTGQAGGAARCSWSYGSESASNAFMPFLMQLGTTGVLATLEAGQTYEAGTTFEWDGVAARLEEKVVGMRKFTLQVQAHSVERDDAGMCMVPLDRLRVGLRRRSTLDRIHAEELSIIRINDAVKMNYKDAARVVSAGSMDVVFYAAFDSIDPIPANWIETIFYTSHLEGTDGVELPVPPNVVNQQIPPP